MEIDFNKHPVLRAYTLLVFHRFKKIDEEVFGSKKYRRRNVEQIQESENVRMELHQKAMDILKDMGIEEVEGIKLLEDECERLVNEKLRNLKDGEVYCGCCRVIIKRDEFDKHSEENSDLHNHLSEELMQISKEATMMRMSKSEDEPEEEVQEESKCRVCKKELGKGVSRYNDLSAGNLGEVETPESPICGNCARDNPDEYHLEFRRRILRR